MIDAHYHRQCHHFLPCHLQAEAAFSGACLHFRSDGSGGLTALKIARATRSGVSSILGIGFGGLPRLRFGSRVSDML